jgi:hypothetical protein
LKETLDHIPGDRDMNFSYAMLLMKKKPDNYTDLIYYLRKSVTEGDSRYQAQFWCARSLFLNNQAEEAKKIFSRLKNLAIDPVVKHSARGTITENGKAITYSGRIVMLEASYGFVRRELYGDDIYLSKFESNTLWSSLKPGMPIKFNVGFNYKGPVAINIKLNNPKH